MRANGSDSITIIEGAAARDSFFFSGRGGGAASSVRRSDHKLDVVVDDREAGVIGHGRFWLAP